MSDPAIPAATLIVMREAAGAPPELLMVERTARMAFAGGAMVFPGGRIDDEDRDLSQALPEPDAAFRIAAIRETLEESGWEVEPTHVLGLYHHDPVDLEYGFLRIAFVAKALRERANHQLDEGIERPVWLTRDEVVATLALHRSPMVLRCIDDYLAGQRFPLSMLNHLD